VRWRLTVGRGPVWDDFVHIFVDIFFALVYFASASRLVGSWFFYCSIVTRFEESHEFPHHRLEEVWEEI
jgi:hypothetical protein